MTTKISGKKYNFQIVSNGEKFYIKAEDKSTLRFSFINNLNSILAEFNIKMDDPKTAESQWIIPKSAAQTFLKTAKEFLSNEPFRNYLEKRLDEDRQCGEWENIRGKN